jgi:hypothetical protein
MGDRPRIVLALSNSVECEAVADWLLADGFEPVRRSSVRAAVEEMRANDFDLLLADADWAFAGGLQAAARVCNPMTPTVVIGDSAEMVYEADRTRAMYLARPVDRAMLVCSVSMAILDGRPIRRSARKVVNRFAAVVNGVPSHIIDVSNEGLRLEVPRGRRLALPPYFNVRVPLIGIAVTVQRMWARSSPGPDRGEVLWCGGTVAVSQNRAAAVGGWRSFVDTISVSSDLRVD